MPESQDLLPTLPPEEEQAPTPVLPEDDPFSSMMERFDEAAALLGLAPDAYSVLRRSDREFKFAIPVEMEPGKVKVLHGYRVQHNLSLGPCLGGLRLDNDLTREELQALAAWNTWKCAALGLPFGGSFGGINFDPRGQDLGVVERVIRRYTAGVLDLIGPERDVTSPDLHCNEQIMAWILDTYSMHVRHTNNAVVVGKPMGLGGTYGRDSAVGLGVRALIEARMTHLRQAGPYRVVVQGAGFVGAQVARELIHRGHKVIGFGDLHGSVFKEEGLDVEAVLAHRKAHGTIRGYGDAQEIRHEELLQLPCDVLVPAATANQITGLNAESIEAKLVVEAANGPTTARADKILQSRGIPVVPDLLGNSAAMIIAYFEWVQNRAGYYWPEDLVTERLERMVVEAYHTARDVAREHKVGLRLATCMVGVKRVAYFDELRGIYA